MELIPSNTVTMTTVEIANLTKKAHKNVLRVCRKFFNDNDLQPAQFGARYIDKKGEERDCFFLDKRLSLALVALIDNSFLMAVIDRWQELESKESQPQQLKYEENYSNDPVIAIRQVQLSIIENQKILNSRLEAVESSQNLIEASKPRELRKDKPPLGYENKGDTATSVSKITQTTKAIVYAALENYSSDIKKKTYIVECTDDAENIIETNPVCYFTLDVINAVKHAVKNSVKRTEYFRDFPTLGNKSMKLKVK